MRIDLASAPSAFLEILTRPAQERGETSVFWAAIRRALDGDGAADLLLPQSPAAVTSIMADVQRVRDVLAKMGANAEPPNRADYATGADLVNSWLITLADDRDALRAAGKSDVAAWIAFREPGDDDWTPPAGVSLEDGE